MRIRLVMLVCLGSLVAGDPTSTAAELFFDDFDTAASAERYQVLEFVPGRDGAEFAFDYGALGIPNAPSSNGDGLVGVRLFANNPDAGSAGQKGAVQLLPLNLEGTIADKDYTVTYDIWMNFNGPVDPINLGGIGATEAFMVGVGFDGSDAVELDQMRTTGDINGTIFSLTGDAGARDDVRSFTNDGYNAPGVNIATANLNGDAYYFSTFPGGVDVSQLPVQGGMGNQSGITVAGQLGFQWHEVRVERRGTSVRFLVDDLLIAEDADADVTGNIVLGYADYLDSVSDAPQWSFGIVDNLTVRAGEPGDFNSDGVLDVIDINLLTAEVKAGTNDPAFDLNADGLINQTDREIWVNQLKHTYFGDANLDGEFNTKDLVQVFQWNQYEDGIPGNSTWETGDWSGDCEFDTQDFVISFQSAGFEAGPRAAVNTSAVPEPAALSLCVIGAAVALLGIRRARSALLPSTR